MALRMVELFVPDDSIDQIRETLEESDAVIHGIWSEAMDGGCDLVRVLVSAGDTEAVLDAVEKRFKQLEDFRLVLLPVEATIPRLENTEDEEEASADKDRLSREELYTDVLEMARFTPVFIAMVALSTVVAAVGLMRDSSVIVLSAMVIAPLLGPNIALALAATLGDRELARTALASAVMGLAVALLLSVALGWLLPVDPEVGEIQTRSVVGLGDIALALAAGTAGALSLSSGASSTLIGVMVAVALLPPAVVTGLLLGAGETPGALLAAGLVATNLLCLVVAAIVVFLIRGIRPATVWEAKKAKRATRRALISGVLLLVALITLLAIQSRQSPEAASQVEQLEEPEEKTE